jgi:hypothetical protein
MPTITFFRQARRDGGIRTGIDIDDQTVLSRFEGAEDDDPTLLWYVDVRCAGPRLPRAAEAARQWLERNEKPIVTALEALAKRVPEGSDPSEWPLKLSKRLPNGVTVIVACSAVRRAEARELADILRDVATRWRERIQSLGLTQAA